jgi:hypothetical protein
LLPEDRAAGRRFIDLAFEMGPVPGMTAKEIKRYIRYIADWRLGQLGLPAIYMIEDHPLPWLTPLLNGVEHANFFETRATEYSKGATRGNWNEVWDSFDKRVECLFGTINRRTIAPTPAALQRMDYPGQHTAIVNPPRSLAVHWQQWLYPGPLTI